MKKCTDSPRFIHQLRLKTTKEDERILSILLDIGRFIYNACLGELLKRVKLMRESREYQRALKMPKKIRNEKGLFVENKGRNNLFNKAKKRYGFSEYSLHKHLTKIYSKTWLAKLIDSLTSQSIASRVFRAVQEHVYGKRGRPRFKGENRLSSIEGKNNASGIRFAGGKLICSAKGRKKLVLTPIYDLKDKHGLEAYALSCPIKYVRLVRKKIKGNFVWYVQLVLEGTPYQKEKNKIGKGVVGLDIGPSTIAVVGEKEARLQAFAEGLHDYRREIGKKQRKMSRSLRATNPENFEDDTFEKNANGRIVRKKGKVKKGAKTWIRSQIYKTSSRQAQEFQRKMAETRACKHGQLANEVLSVGKTIKTEKLSYVSFQKNFGRSVSFRAPGLFLVKLRRKAESAGGEVIEFDTRTTALSQTCHCGKKHKKLLKERRHSCDECGATAQRDLYSAFLARFVEKNQLDISQAKKAWAGAGVLLEQAISKLKETATGKARLASFGLGQS